MMKHTIKITDPLLGMRMFDMNALSLIKDQYRQLCAWRDDGRKPSPALLDDIKVYEYILCHKEPETTAEQYLKAIGAERERQKLFTVNKMKIARSLGWSI